MKKLTITFFFFACLLLFSLLINQFNHHSLATSASETKTADQLAKEAWEYKRKGVTADGERWEVADPLQLNKQNFFILKKINFNGINQANDNLLETVKEIPPLKTYVQLPEKVKVELRNLVQIDDWATKLTNLFYQTRTAWHKKFWNKMREKYFADLRKYNLSSISLFGGDSFDPPTNVSSIPGIASLPFEKLSGIQQATIVPNIHLHSNWEFGVRRKINNAALVRGDETLFLDAKTIWENSFRSTYLADLKKYQLKEIGGVEIASLLKLTEESKFVDFTFPQQDQIHNLVDLANYQTLLATAINQKKEAADVFWTNPANREEIKQLLSYKLSTIDTVNFDQFTSDDLAKSFNELTSKQQEQLSQLVNLENYANKITALLNEEKEAKNFWDKPINKPLLKALVQTSLTTLGEVKIDQLNENSLAKGYLALTSEEKEQVRSLSKLTNFSQAVQQAVVKKKVAEKTAETDQLPLILGLSIGLSSLLLIIIFSYLYWKKQKKKAKKSSHK